MKILFVCEPISPHAARWINQFANSNVEVHILSEDPSSCTICPDLKCGTVYLPKPCNVPPGVTLRVIDSSSYDKHVSEIFNLIESINPTLIHTLGMYVNSTNRCMIVAALKSTFESIKRIPWIYSSWGMDLDWFSKAGEGREIAKMVASQVDVYQSECQRDINYFNELGYNGPQVECLPAFGGVTWDMENLPSLSSRKSIVLKARDQADGDVIGKAFQIFPALIQNAELLKGYTIIAMQAGPAFKQAIEPIVRNHGVNIVCPDRLPKQSDVLDFYRKSRAWFALTLNDGLPSSLVESMSLGAIPVHSDLSSIREWVTDGKNGLLVDVNDPQDISNALTKVLTDDNFVLDAVNYNFDYCKKNWSAPVVKESALKLYDFTLSYEK